MRSTLLQQFSALIIGVCLSTVWILPATESTIAEGTTTFRSGFSTPGDGGAANYVFDTANCSLNGGAGDNGSQIGAADGGCWHIIPQASGYDARIWGAQCGSSDSTTMLQAAVDFLSTAGTGILLWPSCTLTVGGSLGIPSNVKITSAGPVFYAGMVNESGGTYSDPTWPPAHAPALNCTSTSVNCIVINGQGVHIQNLNIGRPMAAPPRGESDTWDPVVYPWDIVASGTGSETGLFLDHLSFTASSQCIDLEGTSNYNTNLAGAQWTIENIWENGCWNEGIKIRNSDNTGRIVNVDEDFWWNRNLTPVGKYIKTHKIGMDFQYASNDEIANIEFFADKVAILWTNSTVTYTNSPLVQKTFAGYNMQFTNIGFNLPCQAMGIGSANATFVNGEMTGMIGAMDGSGQCGSQNAFFDLSSDFVNFSFAGTVRLGPIDTGFAIGGSNGCCGILYIDGADVADYSFYHTGQPFVKASVGASVSFGTSLKPAIRGFLCPTPTCDSDFTPGPLIGAGVDGSGPASEQWFCMGGGSVGGEGSACLTGSGAGAGTNSGALQLFDNTGTNRGFLGAANNTGINAAKCTTDGCKVVFGSINGSHNGIVSFGTDASGHNLLNVNPLPTSCSGLPAGTLWATTISSTAVVSVCP